MWNAGTVLFPVPHSCSIFHISRPPFHVPGSRTKVTLAVSGDDRLLAIARQAVARCEARSLAREAALGLSLGAAGALWVFGAGKACASMARGVADVVGHDRIRGLLVGKAPRGARPADDPAVRPLEQLVAGHPEPDERGVRAGRRMLAELGRVEAGERVVAVLSGGASALLTVPLDGLELDDLRATTRALLAGGVPIRELNVVRKHLSATAGGRLAHAIRAEVDVLVVSDVLGDDPSAIGSGPFAPDPSTFAEAYAVAKAVNGVPRAVLVALQAGVRGERPETPKPGDARDARIRHHIVASHATLVAEAVRAAQLHGYRRVTTLPASAEEVATVARRLAAEARGMGPNELVISGGEPTVLLPYPHGSGGRNQHLALLVARHLAEPFDPGERAAGEADLAGGAPRARREAHRFLALASDGEDGCSDAAGALVSSLTWRELFQAGLDPAHAIDRADSHGALGVIGAVVRTGRTETNVLDLHLLETTSLL
jgi:glycerate 2-kinase